MSIRPMGLSPSSAAGAYPARAGGSTAVAAPLPFFHVKDFGAVGNGVADDAPAFVAAYAAAVAAGGGAVFGMQGGLHKFSSTLTLDQDKGVLVVAYGATIKPAAGVRAVKLNAGRAYLHPITLMGAVIDGGNLAGAGGIEINDHYAACLRDVQVLNCPSGILFTGTSGWTEDSDFQNVYVRNCTVGIDMQVGTGTGSASGTNWRGIHIDDIPEGGTGLRIGAGVDIGTSEISSLIMHTSAASMTFLDIRGTLANSVKISGRFEGSSLTTSTARVAVALDAAADIRGLELDVYFAGTINTLFSNPGNLEYLRSYRAGELRVRASTSNALRVFVEADTQPRTTLRAGRLLFGDGTLAPDTVLSRSGVNELSTDGNMKANGQTLGAAAYTVAMPAYVTRVVEVGTWTDDATAQPPYNARINNSTGTQNDAVSWDIALAAGTYTFDLYHRTGPGGGIYSVQLDGVEVTTVDGYEASAANRKAKKTGVVIATAGRKRLSLVLSTKNASSTGYAGIVGGFAFVRTGA